MTWLIRMRHGPFTCDMTHTHLHERGYVHRDLTRNLTQSCVTWLIRMRHDSSTCDMTHSHVTWLIHTWHDPITCDVSHSHVTWLIRSFTNEATSIEIWNRKTSYLDKREHQNTFYIWSIWVLHEERRIALRLDVRLFCVFITYESCLI